MPLMRRTFLMLRRKYGSLFSPLLSLRAGALRGSLRA
jgi:hypothetical protein